LTHSSPDSIFYLCRIDLRAIAVSIFAFFSLKFDFFEEERMSKKTIGIVLTATGAAVAVISLAADVIGIGLDPGFHGVQLLGIAIGVIVAVVGFRLALSKPVR
jgi:hypothetical protein